MTIAEIASQIRSLRMQLDVLEAKVRSMPQPKQHSFADLKGMLAGESQTTAEEIDAVKYRGLPEDKL